MAQNTVVIKNPSDKLLEVVRKMRDTKEQNKKALLENFKAIANEINRLK